MGKWRSAFEVGRPSEDDAYYGRVYRFGPPATSGQLAEAERRLGFALPRDLRALLSEFNGVKYTTEAGRELGEKPDDVFLDTAEVPGVFGVLAGGGTEWPLDGLRGVAFFCQANGYSALFGVCARPVRGHPAGTVVYLDTECGDLKAVAPNLMAFVRAYDKTPDDPAQPTPPPVGFLGWLKSLWRRGG